ncbi:Xaa-Pro dipeptidase [Metarhizium album ARSEF 1941]|uniref:Xaa-Pro aminopeptidase n=1 Tax=Metarhizium album (strain ARSEF 1941) TaxID=1081103 RepID=A0A0B2WW18_METAS|nr:Xaa-Pro dipeptidase [Metarhizium album ARSEF 1941]KHN97647.1 Xaa-Pro dipeptidase [Metarhizium album ARSEF 1941]
MDYDLITEDEFDALRDDDSMSASYIKYPGKRSPLRPSYSFLPSQLSSSTSTAGLTQGKQTAKLHARKVARELGVDDGLIYLPGLPEILLEDSDQPRLFRQRRYFFYITGANFEDCAATYEIKHDKLTLWIPYVEPRDVLWFGSKPSAVECKRRYHVDEVRYTTQLSKFLRKFAAQPSPPIVYILHPDQAPDLGCESLSRLSLDDSCLLPAMDRARVVKSDYEVAMVRRANDISSAAHRSVAERILRLTNEREIEAIIQAVCIANGSRSQAYPIIAGSGPNASTLHYGSNDAPLKGKQCVVIDAGCEWNCYASDITRTLPLSGSWSPRAAAIHAIVQRMQEECIAEVAPGKLWRDIHLHAASVGMEGLLKLGILKGSREDVARAGTVAAFFPHGLGHHVGLEVHDVSGTLALGAATAHGVQLGFGKRAVVTPSMLADMIRLASSPDDMGVQESKGQHLQPNMIVTVEPGIYFCREYLEATFRGDPTHAQFIDWDLLEEYYDVGGVRIEDCLLVTEHGYQNLTVAPKGDELLDVINKGKK